MRHFALSVVLSAALLGCTDKQDTEKATSPATDSGKSIAETHCAGCHGLDGRGATPEIPHLAAQFEQYMMNAMIAYKEGRRIHAALRDIATSLSDEKLSSVVSYYASLPPLKSEADEATRQAIQSPYDKGKVVASKCAKCHSEDGNSTIPGIPSLAGQQPLYLLNAMRKYVDGSRLCTTPEKKKLVSTLNRIDNESMALYYASQIPAKRPAPPRGNPVAGEPLTASCGGCHGSHGISHDSTIPSLAGQDPDYLMKTISAYRDRRRVQNDMHQAISKVSDDDIADIAAFYATQVSQPAEADPLTMEELAERCDRCHGPAEDHRFVHPKIHGQQKAYLIKAMRDYLDDKRDNSMMHAMISPYSYAFIDSIATLYSTRPAR
jgi:cytochrome c553